VAGGEIAGISALVSASAADLLILIESTELLYADGGADVQISGEASVQLDDAPDDPPNSGTTMVSLWQSNRLALKIIRDVNFIMRHNEGCAYVYEVGGT
jgi:hypothetical protein